MHGGEVGAEAEVLCPRPQPVPALRPVARVPEKIPAVPDLFPQPGAVGRDPWSNEVELVETPELGNRVRETPPIDGVRPMTMVDPISDLLTRIRNANAARHETVDVPASRVKLDIVRILKEEGYIANYVLAQDGRQGTIKVQLRYAAGKQPLISTLERVSRPGCRVYASKSEIPSVLGGIGICIVSTSQGLLTGTQAQEKGLGGEVLCAVS